MLFRATVLALVLVTIPPALIEAAPPRAVLDPADLGVPYRRYTTTDALGRTITFYVSIAPADGPEAKLPVVLWIQGSGCQSLFTKRGDRVGDGLQGLLLKAADGRARVLAVEKPGVKFQDMPARPGAAEGASAEFLKEHTLPRWAEANAAALKAAWTLPGVDPGRTLVIGHSEGGIVAARVAADIPAVTHVASLAGGGPTQLFSMAELAVRPRRDDGPGEAEQRRQEVYDEWNKIQADPESTSKFWRAHPYRRWSTFMQSSLTAELLRSKARVYLVHGTNDAATPVTAFDLARAELAVRNRDVTAERLEGADHGFRTESMPAGSPDGFRAVFGRVLAWFLAAEARTK
ncbi:MAG TPA: alpha/beta fold hydrolase [Gemmataceae bacterium]|nr:alpha/beta fold hydrolase [Gemmataceae bacterium]